MMVSANYLLLEYSPKCFLRLAKSTLSIGRLLVGFWYDYRRYLKYSSTDRPDKHKSNLRSRITERYHNVEKGLSLPAPRVGFGSRKIPALVDYIHSYILQYGADDFIRVPIGVLDQYRAFNVANGASDYPDRVRIERLASLYLANGNLEAVGTKALTRDEILASSRLVSASFFSRRHSVRQFAEGDVSMEDLNFAAEAAAKSPAVCNRQSGRIYFTRNAERISNLLAIQGGAAGFGSGIRALAILTTNLRNFWNVGERNQAWVDGGLFAMSFLLGLHARGLGAVSLNWSKDPSKDRELRRAAQLPDEEAIIFLVGIGHLPETLQVAQSWRPPADQILQSLDG